MAAETHRGSLSPFASHDVHESQPVVPQAQPTSGASTGLMHEHPVQICARTVRPHFHGHFMLHSLPRFYVFVTTAASAGSFVHLRQVAGLLSGCMCAGAKRHYSKFRVQSLLCDAKVSLMESVFLLALIAGISASVGIRFVSAAVSARPNLARSSSQEFCAWACFDCCHSCSPRQLTLLKNVQAALARATCEL